MNQNRLSLPELLQRYQVEIPVIQRDYAQGRKDNKSSAIRTRFVADLISAIGSGQAIHLDFVYGRIRGGMSAELRKQNSHAVAMLLKAIKDYAANLDVNIAYGLDDNDQYTNGDHFIPLDGQQRLTTLYLLYWYLAARTASRTRPRFDRFSYKTRKSSRDFCTRLNNPDFSLPGGNKPSKWLTSQIWFYHQWHHDPTVAGMLVTLDEIHQHYKESSEIELSGYLTQLAGQTPLITFDFLDLDAIEAEDQLYVKMNARGRQLDEFENFKSWLIGHIAATSIDLTDIPDWDKKLDIDWLDIFWKYKKSVSEVNPAQLKFFRRLAQLCFIRDNDVPALPAENKKWQKVADVLDADRNEEAITSEFFEKHQIFNGPALSTIFTCLESLTGDAENRLDSCIEGVSSGTFFKNRLKDVLFCGASLSNFPDRVFAFATVCYITSATSNVLSYTSKQQGRFRSWLRVCQNLIYNARIDEFPEYILAIKAITVLARHCDDIITALTEETYNPITYFSTQQVNEEIRKAKLIQEEAIDEATLLCYEQHFYLYGQLGFLLDASSRDGQFRKELFVKYANRLVSVFTRENLDSPEYLLQRAFLCYGDYFLSRSSERYCFCTARRGNSRDRDENWREVFAMNAKPWFQHFLEDSRSPEQVIKDEAPGISDWRKYFLREPAVFKACRQGLISWKEETDNKPYIRLLGESQLNHYHNELFSFCLYKQLLMQGYNAEYTPVRRGHEFAYLKVEDNGMLIHLRFNPESYQFEAALSPEQPFVLVTAEKQTGEPVIFNEVRNFDLIKD